MRQFTDKELKAIEIAAKCMFEDTKGVGPQELYDWFSGASTGKELDIYVKDIYNLWWEECLAVFDDMIDNIASSL